MGQIKLFKKVSKFFRLNSSKLLIGIIAFLSIFSIISPVIESYAHNTYFLATTIDQNKYRYNPSVIHESNNIMKHKEHSYGYFTHIATGMELPNNNTPDWYENLATGKEGADSVLIYGFPYYHTTDLNPFDSGLIDAGPEDADRASLIADVVINSLNDAITWCYPEGFKSIQEFMDSASYIANAKPGKNLLPNGITIEVTESPKVEKVMKGLEAKDYVKIVKTNKNGTTEERIFIYSMAKGYRGDSPLHTLHESLSEEARKEEYWKHDLDKMNWKHFAFLGNFLYLTEGVTFAQIEDVADPGIFESTVAWLLDNAVMMIRTTLGLSTMEDLMLNKGTREFGYYYGMMPLNWFRSATSLHTVCMIIAWLLLIGAVVKLLALRNLSIVNPNLRISLMEGFMNLFLTGGMLAFCTTIFYFMARMNELLVNIFANSTDGITDVTSQMTLGTGLVGMGFINIILLIIMIYFNLIYIFRAITLSLLYATAPLFVVSIAFGGKYKQLFGNWLKEVVGYIFMQSFHAIVLAFFAFGGAMTTNGRFIESICVAFSFIPLTKFFRQNLIGVGGSFGEQLASSALGMGAKTVGSMMPKGGGGGSSTSSKGEGGTNSHKKGNSSNTTSNKSMNKGMNNTNSMKDLDSQSNSSGGGSSNGKDNFKSLAGTGTAKLGHLKDNAKVIGKSMLKSSPKFALDVASGMAKTAVGVGLTSAGCSEGGVFLASGGQQIGGAINGVKNNAINSLQNPGRLSLGQISNRCKENGVDKSLESIGLNENGDAVFTHNSQDYFSDKSYNDVQMKDDNIVFNTGINFDTGTASDSFHSAEGSADLMQIYQAFKNPEANRELVDNYTAQGISVSRGMDGGTLISMNKNNFGVDHASRDGDKINFVKNNNKNMSVNNDFGTVFKKFTTDSNNTKKEPEFQI